MPSLNAAQKKALRKNIRRQYSRAKASGRFVPPKVARAIALDQTLNKGSSRKTSTAIRKSNPYGALQVY
jgi:hypothetical protein